MTAFRDPLLELLPQVADGGTAVFFPPSPPLLPGRRQPCRSELPVCQAWRLSFSSEASPWQQDTWERVRQDEQRPHPPHPDTGAGRWPHAGKTYFCCYIHSGKPFTLSDMSEPHTPPTMLRDLPRLSSCDFWPLNFTQLMGNIRPLKIKTQHQVIFFVTAA